MTRDQERAMSVMERLVMGQAVAAAARTGLLESLEEGVTTGELTRRHGVEASAVRRLLDVLRAGGLVRLEADRWSVDGDLRAFNEQMPQDLGVIADAMSRLPDFLRSGEQVGGHPSRTNYALSVDRLRPIFSEAAEELARHVEGEVDSVLDLGTGSGVFGIAMAQRHGASLTGFDRRSVLTVFREFVERAELPSTVEAVGGDFLVDDLPQGYDCTLICNVLRVLPPNHAQRLIERAMETLNDGGHLVILDVMGEDPPEHSLRRSIYRLDLALRNDGGGPHDDASIRRWINDAGGEIGRRVRLESAPLAEEALLVRAVGARNR